MRRPRAADKGGSIAGDAYDANDPKRASNMQAKVAALTPENELLKFWCALQIRNRDR